MRPIQTFKLGLSAILFVGAAKAFAHKSPQPEQSSTDMCEELLEGLVKIDLDNPDAFHGMTNPVYKRLVQAQKALLQTTHNANTVFEGLHGIFEMDLLTMATRHNALLSGPPGGAKSAHILWLIPRQHLYVRQMNELMTPSAIFGGLTEDGMKQGLNIRNRKGSITEFEYAMLDELPNMNPSMAGDTLSFMNPGEREHEGVKAITRAVFSTGNATRAEILRTYKENGLFTGPAMLNRSIFKAWVPNWLAEDEQWRMMQVTRQMDHLESAKLYGNKAQREEAARRLIGLQAQYIDMAAIEAFAQHAFVPHEDLMSALKDFANEFRAEMRKAERRSFESAMDKPHLNMLVDTPSADWTNRFFKGLLRTIQFSAALDYLRMVGPEALDPKHFHQPIVLTPMSLWRIMYTATTVGPGENRFNPMTMQIDFNLTKNMVPELQPWDHKIALDGCKDATEVGELEFMWKEQELTNRVLKQVNGNLAVSAREMAPFMPPPTEDQLLGLDRQKVDFEVALARQLNKERPLSAELEKLHQQQLEGQHNLQTPAQHPTSP